MPSDLSGGQRRRVAVARAVAHQPEMILYDEATTGLDPITASTICDLMVKLRDLEGVTTIFVTHQLRDAFQVAQSVVQMQEAGITYRRTDDNSCVMGTEFMMLNRGRIVFHGRMDELKGSTHPYVKTFMA
jgi:phospholipid/cholesterol/gamma-HCH transport system ATP-binding protein